jgi:hypothetical protein
VSAGRPVFLPGVLLLVQQRAPPSEIGRPINRNDNQPGHEHVAVISDRLWRMFFAADVKTVGRASMLSRQIYIFCRSYYRIPFSSRVLRQGMNPGQLFAVFAVAFCLCVAIPSAIEVWVLRSGIRMVWPVIAVAAISVFQVRGGKEEREEVSFESDEEAEIIRLDLSIRGSVFSSVLRNGGGRESGG